MKRQTTVSPVSEVELSVVTRPPARETAMEEQVELAPTPERSVWKKGLEVKPLPLVVSLLGLALLLLIPALLLLQRLES